MAKLSMDAWFYKGGKCGCFLWLAQTCVNCMRLRSKKENSLSEHILCVH